MEEISEDMIEMIKECDCKTCGLSAKCNGVDLLNCYAKIKLTIKPIEENKNG